MTSTLSEDDDFAAAEYVLGVTDLAARMAAEARAKQDADFAAAIARWQAHFAGLDGEYADEPAPNLMPAIEARLFPQAPKRRWGLTFLRVAPVLAMALVAGYFYLAPVAPDMTATLVADAGDLSYSASLNGTALTITRVKGSAADQTHSHELWLIKGSDAPISLGVIPANGETIALPDAAAGYVLAVSLEPKGGSPTGQPTGPVLALGALQKA